MSISVLTLVRDRTPHLRQLVEGLRRSRRAPRELVVVEMGGEPVGPLTADFPIRVERREGSRLPLAAARNLAAQRAASDDLMFLDVDCIPMADCLGRMADALCSRDGLLCADVRYLGPRDARGAWSEPELLARGRAHPLRRFPTDGVRQEPNPGLFWSLAFAVRRTTFKTLGGFDEAFEGYGAEDTDFGLRAAATGLPLLFVGGALACHQHHESHEPPVQHLADIVRNAGRFHDKWGRWPMEGWLEAFAAMGLIDWREDSLVLKRRPMAEELSATRVAADWSLPVRTDSDRIAASPVQAA